eukprot:gene2514-2873_t
MTQSPSANGASEPVSKKIYIVRHGQSTFNEAYARNNGVDPFLFDAQLTELGQTQANNLEKDMAGIDLDLVVSSPLSRALDTTRRGFGKMIKEKGTKVEVIAIHTELLISSDDNGRPKSEVQKEFPDFDLTNISERWWYLPEEMKDDFTVDYQEYFKKTLYTEPMVQEFKEWLMARPENNIAVVGHSMFFYHLFDTKIPILKNCQVVQWDMTTNDTKVLNYLPVVQPQPQQQ